MNLGPLTTIYQPAPGCNASIYGLIHTESQGSTITTHKYHSLGLPITSQCYPPGFSAAAGAFYSPGLCPSDWTSACGSTEVIGSVTETRATCCPRGYVCMHEQEDPWSTLSCSRFETGTVSLKVPQFPNTIYMETSLERIYIHANDIEVRWQDGDFEMTTTSEPPSAVSTPATSRPRQTNTAPTSEVLNPAAASSDQLSAGAYAGIGVGVGIALIALLTLFVLLVRRRRRRQRSQENGSEDGAVEIGMAKDHIAEMDHMAVAHEVDSRDPRYGVGEMDATRQHELEAEYRSHELDRQYRVHTPDERG